MSCEHCGNKVRANAKFCSVCGAALKEDSMEIDEDIDFGEGKIKKKIKR